MYGGNQYRLGDLVHGFIGKRIARLNVSDLFCSKWKGSIGCEYALGKHMPKDYVLLEHLVQKRMLNPEWKHCLAPRNAIVIHLRVGDVFDWSKYDCNKKALHSDKDCHYATRTNAFQKLSALKNVSAAVVVGNPFYRKDEIGHDGRHSLRYMSSVCDILRRHFTVIQYTNRSADCDLLTMCTASFLVSSKGGFAKIAQYIVQRQNGTLINI
jgi:hypothetical protein